MRSLTVLLILGFTLPVLADDTLKPVPDTGEESPDEPKSGIVCPYYWYMNNGSYCSWYGMKCGIGPTSIDLACNHPPGSCPNTDCEPVMIAAVAAEDAPLKNPWLPAPLNPNGNPTPGPDCRIVGRIKILIEVPIGDVDKEVPVRVNLVAAESRTVNGDYCPGAILAQGYEVTNVPPNSITIESAYVHPISNYAVRVEFGNLEAIVELCDEIPFP